MRKIGWMAMVLVAGCDAGGTLDSGDTAGFAEFCATLEDGGRYIVEDGGGNSGSGLLHVRVLTNQSGEVADPLYVAFKSYTLENVDAGGVQTTGQTSGDGLVEEMLGAGTWDFEAAYPRGSTPCTARIEVPVEAERTTYACPVMTCPQ